MSGPRLPKRAFAQAAAAPSVDGFSLVTDGKPVRTPRGGRLCVPARALAEAIAVEWNALGEWIDPQALPLTRLANTALDGTSANREAIALDLARHAEFDLLCYRAGEPAGLAELQAQQWDPMVEWAAARLGLRLTVVTGIVPVAQPPETLAACLEQVRGLDDFSLTALHLATSLTGSIVLGFAVVLGELDADAAFDLAHLDEIWQAERWGADSEAQDRLDRRRRELTDTQRFARAAAPGANARP